MKSPSTAPIPNERPAGEAGGGSRKWAAFAFGVAASAFAAVAARRRFRAYVVEGESMEPVFRDGDFLFVDRAAYRREVPHPHDIVVAKSPVGAHLPVVKRVERVDLHRDIWLRGDNAEMSTDSRDYGPVRRDALVGRVLFRYWPRR